MTKGEAPGSIALGRFVVRSGNRRLTPEAHDATGQAEGVTSKAGRSKR